MRKLLGNTVLAAMLIGAGCAGQQSAETSENATGVPVFEVDPSWPKLPAKWKLGDAA